MNPFAIHDFNRFIYEFFSLIQAGNWHLVWQLVLQRHSVVISANQHWLVIVYRLANVWSILNVLVLFCQSHWLNAPNCRFCYRRQHWRWLQALSAFSASHVAVFLRAHLRVSFNWRRRHRVLHLDLRFFLKPFYFNLEPLNVSLLRLYLNLAAPYHFL